MLHLHPIFRWLRFLHRWLSLIIGLQLLVWVGSGLLMSLIDQAQAGGSTTRASVEMPRLGVAASAIIAPVQLNVGAFTPLGLKLTSLADRPVYQIETDSGFRLYDALTGRLAIIDATLAQHLALMSYAGPAAPGEAILLPQGVAGIHAIAGPLWEVPMNDSLQTRVYVHGDTGVVVAHRNARGELMETLLMLHFMDYFQRGGFNNPQIIATAFLTLWLAISGFLLLFVSFRSRRW
ncbi:MAG: PepSY domain-containing protein [Halioglobus sp.]